MTDSKPTKTPHVLAEVLVAHQYPHDGPQHAVGTTYELPASDFEAFLGMGYVRRCERPDNSLPGAGAGSRPHPDHELPGAGTEPPHVEPHRGDTPHADHSLPGHEPRPRPKAKG